MTKPNLTEIIVVLDRSGSMSSIASDMRGGFDSFIEKQKATVGECRVTLVQFDDQYDTVYTARPVAEVPKLELSPRGSTALLDAVGRTIDMVGLRLKNTPEGDRPSKVVFMIITDGMENASREYSNQKVASMTKHQQDKYGWEFMYLGANQDAYAVAMDIGILRNIIDYRADAKGASALFGAASAGITSHREEKTRGGILVTQQAYDQAVADLGGTPGEVK